MIFRHQHGVEITFQFAVEHVRPPVDKTFNSVFFSVDGRLHRLLQHSLPACALECLTRLSLRTFFCSPFYARHAQAASKTKEFCANLHSQRW